uniref:Uncharacterized protein n=1 Tax=Oryza glumipatula TaxID=40148 RepID=A0A0E0BMF7_9ORYZ
MGGLAGLRGRLELLRLLLRCHAQHHGGLGAAALLFQEQFEPQLQLDPQLQDIFSQSVIKLKQLKMKSTKEKKKSF